MEADVRALFEGANYAHVATVMADGSPHSVAVWVGVLEGDRIAFYTQTSSLKAKNLERDPRVAISITDHGNPYTTARIRGTVVEKRYDDDALAVMDVISNKYTGSDFPVRGPGGVLFVVEPEKVSYMHLPFEHKPAS